MQNDDNDFTRPLGATPTKIQRMIDGANADLAEGKGEGIGNDVPTVPSKSRKRRASAVRRRSNEVLHADARLRIYKTGNGNEVRIVLSGARSGTSVEATCNGNLMLVMVTLARLWLRGASMLAKDTTRELHSADTENAKQAAQLRLE